MAWLAIEKTTCAKAAPPRHAPSPGGPAFIDAEPRFFISLFPSLSVLSSYSILNLIIIFSPHINLQSIIMDLSELPAHEVGTAFESHLPSTFQTWVLDRSAEIVEAARRVHGDAQRSSAPPHNISDTDAVIVNNMLGYAKNLEMLHVNLAGLTMRLMFHHPGRTAAEVQQLDGWRITVSLLLTSIIIFFSQDVIDAVS
jgi:hypothetical protein